MDITRPASSLKVTFDPSGALKSSTVCGIPAVFINACLPSCMNLPSLVKTMLLESVQLPSASLPVVLIAPVFKPSIVALRVAASANAFV